MLTGIVCSTIRTPVRPHNRKGILPCNEETMSLPRSPGTLIPRELPHVVASAEASSANDGQPSGEDSIGRPLSLKDTPAKDTADSKRPRMVSDESVPPPNVICQAPVSIPQPGAPVGLQQPGQLHPTMVVVPPPLANSAVVVQPVLPVLTNPMQVLNNVSIHMPIPHQHNLEGLQLAPVVAPPASTVPARAAAAAPPPEPTTTGGLDLLVEGAKVMEQKEAIGVGEARANTILQQLGLLNSTRVQDVKFTELLRMLSIFHSRYGHFKVSKTEFKRLGKWVENLRNQGCADPQRKEALDRLGFNWQAQVRAWEFRFQELLAYREIHGNCEVPKRYKENQPLANWVRAQRSDRKKSKELTDKKKERFRRLDEIGFSWAPAKKPLSPSAAAEKDRLYNQYV